MTFFEKYRDRFARAESSCRRLAAAPAFLGGIALAVLLGITVAEVFWRYVLNDSLLWIEDVSTMSLAVVVAAAIAHGAREGSHVCVNLIARSAGRRVTRITDAAARLLGVAAAAPVLLTRDTPVRTLEDMHGLKIRVSSRSLIPFIEALGASAVMQPGTVVHQSLTTGVIDGVAISPSGISTFQLHEPTAYLTDWLPASGLPFVLLMNRGVYASLTPEERGWIDEAADTSLSAAGAEAYARAGAEALRMARAAGAEFIRLAEGERRRFEQAIASVRAAGLGRRVGDMTAGEVIRSFGATP